tara:strand:+ start:66671 stop:69064 length:2394 start_codon:yes stop_codon:yes gene_type:complete
MVLFCALVVVLYINAQLPSVEILEDIQLQVPLKIYTADGKLIGEYGVKRRTPIGINDIPEKMKLAILATEDRRFYQHGGVDLRGLIRAAVTLIATGRKQQGASTITMQVARNFFLTRKKTFSRKLHEILIARKIEKELSKDKILELYLNKIYFGKRAYGVQAAAQVYYGTTIDKLDLAQLAMIAGLPQAPSAANPINNPERAMKRRTHVLNRMYHYDFITEAEHQAATQQPISSEYHGRYVELDAPFVAEMARKKIVRMYGRKAYTAGFEAYTTIDSRLQTIAQQSVQEGLLEYDKRHGYRGPYTNLDLDAQDEQNESEWLKLLKQQPKTASLMAALVLSVTDDAIQVLLANGQKVSVAFDSMRWAKERVTRLRLGPEPKEPSDVAIRGDVIYVEADEGQWIFSQLPEVQGALVALHPKNGAVLSLVGGFDFNLSKFNRAYQSTRQPGSNFKPFIYSAAIENGFTAASLINDAPIVYMDENLEGYWRPQNDSRRFYGPTRLRVGLTKSRNLVSIRLLQQLGLDKAINTLSKFGFPKERLPRALSLALGTAQFSPIELAGGYATFANGGYKVAPFVLQRIEDNQNNLIYQANPPTACPECHILMEANLDPNPVPQNKIDALIQTTPLDEPNIPAEKALAPQTAYIMTSILQDAIQTGTGRRAKKLHRRDLAGKTGTTNNKVDAWYSGFNQSLVTSVWVGYDTPRTLKEYGSQAALPIWMKYMGAALEGVPETRPEQPRGLVTVKIDPDTGALARPGQSNAMFEIFRTEHVPNRSAPRMSVDRSLSITPKATSSGESLF